MSLYRILLVYPETKKDLGGVIRIGLEEKLFEDIHQIAVDWVKTETAARDRLNDPQSQYHLIVTALQIPSGPKIPLNPAEARGLTFLKSRSQKLRQIPSILVAASKSDDLARSVQELPRSWLVLEGAGLLNDLLGNAEKLLTKVSYTKPAPEEVTLAKEPVAKEIMGNINISLNLHDRIYSASTGEMVRGQYEIKGHRFNYFKKGEIDLGFRTLRRLARKSKDLEKESGWPKWEKMLRDVGETLKKQICDKNEQFRERFLEIVEKVQGIENTRIRFNLMFEDKKAGEEDEEEERTDDLHSVVLEALVDFDEREFLMLQAPICRRLDFESAAFSGQYPLFNEKGPDEVINCLIIEAYTWGLTDLQKDGEDVELKRLEHLKEESDWLENYLGNMDQVKVGQICRISEDKLPANSTFKAYLEEVLKKGGPWHLVHYAGHSLYDDEQVGYVFFPQEEDIVPFKIDIFSKDLRQAKPRFVYLSSCYSSQADFVFQLANNGIPAILGFRWSIDDKIAGECAKIFYQSLFTTKDLEGSFLKTRRDIHDKYLKNKIWAAPLLVYQTCD